MSQPQSSGGSCNYAQNMADQSPKYDSQVRKGKRCTCGKKPCVCKKKK